MQKGIVVIMVLIIIGCWTKFFYDVRAEIRQRDSEVMVQEIENALNEVKPGWEKKSVTVDQPATFEDDEGNTIVYHCLETTHYDTEPEESISVNIDVVGLVVDISEADSTKNCMVNDMPAILCEEKNRAYLCWTLSSQYSFVIEYSPDTVLDEEIFRIAEELRVS